MSKRVVFYGYSDPGMLDGMRQQGWEVHAGDKRNWFAWAHGNLESVPKGSSADFGAFVRQDVDQVQPHLVIIGKGFDSNVPDPAAKPPFFHLPVEDVAWVRKRGAIVVYLTLDDPADLGFAAATNMLAELDAVGTCCIGTRVDYESHTTAPVFEFWPAWDHVLRGDPVPAEDERCDVVFVGTPYTSNRDGTGPSISRRDVALSAIEMGAKVHVYGRSIWLDRQHGGDPRIEPHYRGELAWDRLHHVFGGARITYNSFVRQGQRYMNDRVPIAGGAGSFLLMEDQMFLGRDFAEGVHVGYHRRGKLESFKERLAWWLEHEEERAAAAAKTRALILSKHTMLQRGALLSAVYEEAVERRRAAQPGCCRGS